MNIMATQHYLDSINLYLRQTRSKAGSVHAFNRLTQAHEPEKKANWELYMDGRELGLCVKTSLLHFSRLS